MTDDPHEYEPGNEAVAGKVRFFFTVYTQQFNSLLNHLKFLIHEDSCNVSDHNAISIDFSISIMLNSPPIHGLPQASRPIRF